MSRRYPLHRILGVVALLLGDMSAHAGETLINNGLAPPNPENVITETTTPGSTYPLFMVRDQGCVYSHDPCDDSSGNQTTVLVEGIYRGAIAIYLYDSSHATFESWGSLRSLSLNHNASVLLSNANIDSVTALGSTSVVFEGGRIDRAGIYADSGGEYLQTGGTVERLTLGRDIASAEISGGTVHDLSADGPITVDGMSLRTANFDNTSLATLSASSVANETDLGDRAVVIADDVDFGPMWLQQQSSIELNSGEINGLLKTTHAAEVDLRGGNVLHGIEARISSTVEIDGGVVEGVVHAWDEAWVIVTGGVPGEALVAHDMAWVRVRGSDFAIDGASAELGFVVEPSGRLTGTLADGTELDVMFYQEDAVDPDLFCEPCTGTLSLEPAEVTE